MNLDGHIVLVTGASGGIGHAISGRLAAGGATVALGYSRNQTTAETLAATITAPLAAAPTGLRPRLQAT